MAILLHLTPCHPTVWGLPPGHTLKPDGKSCLLRVGSAHLAQRRNKSSSDCTGPGLGVVNGPSLQSLEESGGFFFSILHMGKLRRGKQSLATVTQQLRDCAGICTQVCPTALGSRRIANGVAGSGLATWPSHRMPPEAQGGLQLGSLETEPEAGMKYL